MVSLKKMIAACVVGIAALSVAAPASLALDQQGNKAKHEKMKEKHKKNAGHKYRASEKMGPEAAAMKKRHQTEWKAMMEAHKANMKGAGDLSKDDRKAMKARQKAEKKEMKARHKAEWAAFKESQGKGKEHDDG